jgi:hypothetical protein
MIRSCAGEIAGGNTEKLAPERQNAKQPVDPKMAGRNARQHFEYGMQNMFSI